MTDFLTAKVGLYVLGAVCLLLALGLVYRSCQLSSVRKDLTACQEKVDDLQGKIGAKDQEAAQLRVSISQQNAAISLLEAEAEMQTARAERAEAKSQEIRVVTQEKVTRIMQARVPTDCEGAVGWQRDQLLGQALQWSSP